MHPGEMRRKRHEAVAAERRPLTVQRHGRPIGEVRPAPDEVRSTLVWSAIAEHPDGGSFRLNGTYRSVEAAERAVVHEAKRRGQAS